MRTKPSDTPPLVLPDPLSYARVLFRDRFKVQQAGYDGGNWATSAVITNGGFHYITIPSCIESGQYLLRAEMVALHAATTQGGAQFYVSLPCPAFRL